MTVPVDAKDDADPASVQESLRFRSPWLDQLDQTTPQQPLDRDLTADVLVVGAGIAGVATAYFTLRDTPDTVVMVERSRVGRGASGRNAGQLVTYFERPLCSLVDAYGFDMATRAQAEVDTAWDLLDGILDRTGIPARIERFEGAMGMYTLNHVLVHLRNQLIRREAGLIRELVQISDRAPFIADIPKDYAGLYTIVPQSHIQAKLAGAGDDFLAVLLNRKGCGNSALLAQELLIFLKRTYADRFTYIDGTTVDKIVLGPSDANALCGDHCIAASRVVLCTNGFTHHKVENKAGEAIGDEAGNNVDTVVGYMAGFLGPSGAPPEATSFIRNAEIGGKLPYYYVTRRPYLRGGDPATLTCLGGPEAGMDAHMRYEPESDMPADIMWEFENEVRPAVVPDRAAGAGYDFTWHGLMGYTKDKIRLVGFEPRNPVLMYNLGCNGIGFLPSISGGLRIARLHRGDALEPSIFDPK
jgi:glycine/D-amino acid oxidase-like deaminating enzyme